MRLDKFLCHVGIGTRTEVQKLIKKKRVTVDDVTITNAGLIIRPEEQEICLDNEVLTFKQYYYFVLNKPQGVITATEDSRHETVLDLLDFEDQNKKVSPVGRLDKDTEGLLILTNDGKTSHQLLSPKKHVPKVYYAKIEGELINNACEKFVEGIILEDNTQCLPAKLEILGSSEVKVTLQEGKFHQVKRMIKQVGAEVVYLKRIKMGNLDLPSDLELGEYRELTEQELLLLKGEN
ncbi:MAG: 16S rRNA pseudouridine(516) synthase [Epulopiscium sp. Nele67-Bin005]|nr:MAG: 16S rRNA pseudouridine(516) synthase [Epulopiscium sp. Nele67-Bin005]